MIPKKKFSFKEMFLGAVLSFDPCGPARLGRASFAKYSMKFPVRGPYVVACAGPDSSCYFCFSMKIAGHLECF